ncbi:MAG TPA: FAD-dependent oxidoreductase [Clostridiaceae bacterium]|nr:FAD-dependent oxidoreductase [Clostridiaceae bacterium]
MRVLKTDIAIIGAGPAGLAAALEASRLGKSVTLIERSDDLGGILQQCIHDGFGLIRFKKQLSGPQYAERFIEELKVSDVSLLLDTTVLSIEDKVIFAVSPKEGVLTIHPGAIVLAMGCRERTRSQVEIYGTRPSGVMTAGTVQRYINLEGYLPGRRAVILGSGDIGLIMARRMHLEGIEVLGVYEVMPEVGGLARNVYQCLIDYDIPLHLSTTVTEIFGRERLEGVRVVKVDEDRRPIEGTEGIVACDLLVLSVGLIPENELSRKAGVCISPVTKGPVLDESMMTTVPGIFAAGNVAIVFDLVDYVSDSAEAAARGAVRYLDGQAPATAPLDVIAGNNVASFLPSRYHVDYVGEELSFFLRVKKMQSNARVVLKQGDTIIKSKKQQVVRPAEMVALKLTQKDLALIEASSPLVLHIEA